MSEMPYCQNPFVTKRRKTRVVPVGDVGVGGDNPIRIQSMTTTDTLDTAGTVAQIISLVEAGCEIVRLTAPSIDEAENLKNIKRELKSRGIRVPLVADIHYTPNAALKAAEFVEKVRINPGNYVDRKKFSVHQYTDDEYDRQLERIEEKFRPLVLKAKQYGVSLRIGTNHGSLSDRIMNRYGDTPAGMVESALEFVRICERHGFQDIILSMKASNPQVMIQAYRLLAARMNELGMDYPFHLGVTEAGDGPEGRIKSAIGIGSLLADGIGDTIRVSLTEDPVAEIEPAYTLAAPFQPVPTRARRAPRKTVVPAYGRPLPAESPIAIDTRDPYTYSRRQTRVCPLGPVRIGGEESVRVALSAEDSDSIRSALEADVLNDEDRPCELLLLSGKAASPEGISELRTNLKNSRTPIALGARLEGEIEQAKALLPQLDFAAYLPAPRLSREVWTAQLLDWIHAARRHEISLLWDLRFSSLPVHLQEGHGEKLKALKSLALELVRLSNEAGWDRFLFTISDPATIAAYRFLAGTLERQGCPCPILLFLDGADTEEPIWVESSITLGSLLCDGIGDGICIASSLSPGEILDLSFNILQGSRLRLSKTEFISCPSCGRTLFDLETATRRIKSRIDHLKGVKVAIMGCIVNGPGEMADADFGYVGAGPGKINLYVGKECIERNIPSEQAEDKLVELIKSRGKWVEPNGSDPIPSPLRVSPDPT